MLECSDLTIEVAGRTLIEELSIELGSGEFVAVLGRNGTGKTLTLHTLAGVRGQGHRIRLLGRTLNSCSRRDVARHLALLLQSYEDPFPSSVMEAVLIGRHPHIDFWSWESESDRAVALDALADMDLAGMEGRLVETLSGGERRRLAIAAIISQEPDVFLLDEPTNHLDPRHQVGVLTLFRHQADRGKAVLTTLHDANLAARFANKALLLFGDGNWEFGPVRETITAESLSRVYETPIKSIAWGGEQFFVPVAPN